MEKKQLVVIHGGDTYASYEEYVNELRRMRVDLSRLGRKGWKAILPERLGEAFEVIAPTMPNKQNAKYEEWRIVFEKYFPFLRDGVILLGHSLGGLFLAKYLAENKFPVSIGGLFLVAVPFDNEGTPYTLADFALPTDLTNFTLQASRVRLYYSKDDAVVPFINAKKYHQVLPEAHLVSFEDRRHFDQEEFPELVEDLLQS